MSWFGSIGGAISSFASSAVGALSSAVTSIGSQITTAANMAAGKLGGAFSGLQANLNIGRGLGLSLQLGIGGMLPAAWKTAMNIMANPFGAALSAAGSILGNMNATFSGALGPLVAKASFNLAIPAGAGLGFGANLNLGPISLSLNNSSGNKATVSAAINAQALLGQTIPTSISLRSVGEHMTVGVNMATSMINGTYIGGSNSIALKSLPAAEGRGNAGGTSGEASMSGIPVKTPANPHTTYGPNNWINPNTGLSVPPPANGLIALAHDGMATTTPNGTNPKSKNTPFFDPSQPGLMDTAYSAGYAAAGFTDSMIDAAGVRPDGPGTSF